MITEENQRLVESPEIKISFFTINCKDCSDFKNIGCKLLYFFLFKQQNKFSDKTSFKSSFVFIGNQAALIFWNYWKTLASLGHDLETGLSALEMCDI